IYMDRAPGQNPHVNYEPSGMGGLQEAAKPGRDHEPRYEASLVRQPIERTNNFSQAGETFRSFEAWEQDELIANLVDAFLKCNSDIRDRMSGNLTEADIEYGRRVSEGLKQAGDRKIASGQTDPDQAVKLSQQEGREAGPY
ncbi:catalase, partial [Paenibacillus sepulcri]|nr:catalase [Paenibacillus sepulcri]